MLSIPYCKQNSGGRGWRRGGAGMMFSEEKQQRRNHPHWLCEQHGLLWEDSDHFIAFGWNHSLPGMLLAVDLVFHEEVSFLLEIGVAVAAHIALRVTLLVPDLHKHPSGEGTSTSQHQVPITAALLPSHCPPSPGHTSAEGRQVKD